MNAPRLIGACAKGLNDCLLAASGETRQSLQAKRQHERAERLLYDWLQDKITDTAFHLEVQHWPGGFPFEIVRARIKEYLEARNG